VKLGKVSITVKTFGVCDFSRLAVTNWRLRRWRLWFLALMTATQVRLGASASFHCQVLLGLGTKGVKRTKIRSVKFTEAIA